MDWTCGSSSGIKKCIKKYDAESVGKWLFGGSRNKWEDNSEE
jgi:hypothetical protein